MKPLKLAGYDVQAGENRYHCRLKTGKSPNSATRKYSKAFVELAQRVLLGQPYEVRLEGD